MSSHPKESIHRIYLLTVWREDGQRNQEENWRFLLEDPRSGRRSGFVTVEALVAGLLDAIDNSLIDHADDSDSAAFPGC